jgi:cobalt/nickel transport protein
MKRRQNLLLIARRGLLLGAAAVAGAATGRPGRRSAVEIFAGADDQARRLIGEINPDYQPWFAPLIEPASGEIASLFFALQAAIGAGFIGYYLGAR